MPESANYMQEVTPEDYWAPPDEGFVGNHPIQLQFDPLTGLPARKVTHVIKDNSGDVVAICNDGAVFLLDMYGFWLEREAIPGTTAYRLQAQYQAEVVNEDEDGD